MGILFVTAAGLIQLFVVGMALVTDGRDETIATLLAVQKVEELRVASRSSPSLSSSPANALETNAPGYSDVVDSRGRPAAASSTPQSAVYLRRWAIRPVVSGPVPITCVQVLVTTPRREGSGARGVRSQRDQADALLSFVRDVQ